jgi:hypothetical protein
LFVYITYPCYHQPLPALLDGTNLVMPLCAGAARLVSPAEFPEEQILKRYSKLHPFKMIPEGPRCYIYRILSQTLSKEEEKLPDAVPKRLALCGHVNWLTILDQ